MLVDRDCRDARGSSRLQRIVRGEPERVFFTLVLLAAADNTTNAMSMTTHPITPRTKITAFDSAERKRGEGIGGEWNLRLRLSNSAV